MSYHRRAGYLSRCVVVGGEGEHAGFAVVINFRSVQLSEDSYDFYIAKVWDVTQH